MEATVETPAATRSLMQGRQRSCTAMQVWRALEGFGSSSKVSEALGRFSKLLEGSGSFHWKALEASGGFYCKVLEGS